MLLTHISLTNFRNYTRLDVELPGGPILFVGGNAQGKTSLLEAVYLLATFSSFHAAHDRQLINFFTAREPLAVARVVADFRWHENRNAAWEGNHNQAPLRTHRLEIRLIQEVNGIDQTPRFRKEVLMDGAKRKISEAIGAFNAVLFLPQMMNIIEGSPDDRRRYLNLMISQVEPGYAGALTEYGRVLTQRNALLKQLSEKGGDIRQLTYWDEKLAAYGARIVHSRIKAIQEVEKIAAGVHQELTRYGEVLRLSYLPAYDPLPRRNDQPMLKLDTPVDRSSIPVEKIETGFRESLEKVRREEIARGVTTLGPHRDETRFLANGIDLSNYGSRGQARTAVLSLKLAEVLWMRSKTDQWPVLLLDEVLAELDPARRCDLLNRLSESEQALLTTTDLDVFSKEFSKRATIWRIDSGRILA